MAAREGYDEFAFIRWIRGEVVAGEGVLVGIGDDAAHVGCTGGGYLATTDMLLEGTHFEPSTPWRFVGRKGMAVSLSDIAAMGGIPRYALCAVGISDEMEPGDARELFRGMHEAAREFDCQVVGGNVSSWGLGTVVCTTVMGEVAGRKPLCRNGARVGDAIVVTGELGGSLAGRHLHFTPRVAQGIHLSRNYEVHSCIDVSDGLGQDMGRILEESGVGALIRAGAVPVSDAAVKAAASSGKTPLEHALSDGEDFELLFTMPQAQARLLQGDGAFGVKVSVIGEVVERGYLLENADGTRSEFRPQGYVHFRRRGQKGLDA